MAKNRLETAEPKLEDIFLEVDEGNVAARGLYGKLGFSKVGERRAYYAAADGTRSTALVMRRDLR